MNTEPTEPKNINNTLPPPPVFEDASEFNAAYERRLAEIKAVPDDELRPLPLDVHATVATVLGALPEIRNLRDEMGKLAYLNLSFVDAVEDYAEATSEANSRYVTALTPAEDIVALNDAAVKMRETIRSDATALANRGLIDPARLTPFKGLVGYKNVGFELMDWATLMRDSWASINGKTALTAQEVQNAKHLGERLVRAAGLREQAPAVLADVARIRRQALSLLVDAYDEVRRGVLFLRWHQDDAETIAPSLYAGRGHKQSDVATTGQPAPVPPQPTPVQNGGAPAAGNGTNVQPVAPVAAPAPGMPGASPFIHA